MQFYKVFQSEEELEQIRAYLVFYDHRHLTLYTFQKKIYIYMYIPSIIIHKVHIAVILNYLKLSRQLGIFLETNR